jgi:metal-responsive CopG/Arc/MetJ family transcriptional regulator
MSKNHIKVRFTVGFTPEQASRLDELNRVRRRKGEMTSRATLIRDAVGFYLQHQGDLVGSRRAIANSLEAKIDALDGKVETMAGELTAFIAMVSKKREGK